MDKVLLFLFIAIKYLSSVYLKFLFYFLLLLELKGKPEKEREPGPLLGSEVFILHIFFLGNIKITLLCN